MLTSTALIKNIATTSLLTACVISGLGSPAPREYDATITIDDGRPISVFDPNNALGAGIDGHSSGEIDKLLSPANIDRMLTAGFKPITYRLRTELANDAWHWNPKGTWSDPSENQGYWTSDDVSTGDISLAYGYALPRRGNTIDQANNNGYSRIDDGDPDTFWKSDPYLDRSFTNDDADAHRQWVVIDLGAEAEINAIRILWGTPFAVKYKIQYGKINDISDIAQNPPDLWHDFAEASVKTKTGGDVFSRLAKEPVKTRYIRVLMAESSNTGPAGSKDIRDRVGFAIREIFVGKANASGQLADELRHGMAANAQSVIYVSSTDPWHRSSDIDHDAEHIGFDRLVKSGLTDSAPMMTPVGVLYDTPENAAAEIGYLTKRGYRISGVEIGEEPDGQYVTPEDYAALYIQWAEAIHKINPNVKLGGPSFQDIKPDTRGGKYMLGNAVWLGRFVNYLKKWHRSEDFSFFSFEWYPFDDVCRPTGPQVEESTRMLRQYLDVFRRHGLDEKIPLIISEYGYSAFSTAAEMNIEGALFNADTIGAFMSLGGKGAYLYGYEPDQIERDFPCTAGNNMLFLDDANGIIQIPTATYFGAQMAMREWLQPAGGEHKLYSSEIKAANIKTIPVAAYPVLRPDGKWSLMLINRDAVNTWKVSIRFNDREKKTFFESGADLYQFSGKDYQWDATLGRPTKNDPPEHVELSADNTNSLQLPPYSLTVLRKKIMRFELFPLNRAGRF